MNDLTLRCPVCGDRADMCFAHGDDWKKRPLPPLYKRTEAQLRACINEFTQDDPPPYRTDWRIRLTPLDEQEARALAFNGGRYPVGESYRLLRLALHEIDCLREDAQTFTSHSQRGSDVALSAVLPFQMHEALTVARFWLRTLNECDCPPETYPTGDIRTLHEPFCSTNLRLVASALCAANSHRIPDKDA